VKGWHAVLPALLFLFPPGALAADSLSGAARELARQTAALAGKGEPVLVVWQNVSSLGPTDLAQARGAFESALAENGARGGDGAASAEARITLSENSSQFLLVEEARKGDERHVWIAGWKRAGPATAAAPGITLDRKLVWEQEEQILDVAFPAGSLLVLSPSKVTLYTRRDGRWEPRENALLTPTRPWPRDLRGRLKLSGSSGSAFDAYLPGMTCSGATEPALTLNCRASDEPWVIESGRFLLLGNFAAARNYFDGRAITQAGVRKTLAPFYSAAAVEEHGQPLWLLTMVDGTTRVFDGSLEPAGGFGGWGSDIAGVDARCGGAPQVLAARAGEFGEPDAVQAFAIVNRAPSAPAAAVEFAGPVTALWPSGGPSAIAVARDLATGKYQAYALTVACGS
jgi:hypothetical protein